MGDRLGAAAAVAALVMLAGCGAALQTTGGNTPAGGTAAGDAQRTISTSGTGEVAADADRAAVTVAVTARADTAEGAREAVATNATRLRGALRDAAVGNGAEEVRGVTFTLADETRAALREEALARAMSAARADADTVASSAGLSITGVQSARTGGGVGPAYGIRESVDGGETAFDAGSVTVTATVDVTYTAAA